MWLHLTFFFYFFQTSPRWCFQGSPGGWIKKFKFKFKNFKDIKVLKSSIWKLSEINNNKCTVSFKMFYNFDEWLQRIKCRIYHIVNKNHQYPWCERECSLFREEENLGTIYLLYVTFFKIDIRRWCIMYSLVKTI